MSTPGATMGAVSDGGEDPSPSLSLLQRLKKLRAWQERQRQELLQTQTYAHTPTAPSLPPLLEEINFDASIVEDSTPTPLLVPQKIQTHLTPTGLPGAGSTSPSPVVPVTSNFPVKSTGIEESISTPKAIPQGCHASVGLPGVEPSPPVLPVAADLVLPHRSFPEEVNARLLEEDVSVKPSVHDNLSRGKVEGVGVWERDGGGGGRESGGERKLSPLTPQEHIKHVNTSHQNDPQKVAKDEGNMKEESEFSYDTHVTDTSAETPYSLPSASHSPHEDPSEYMDESMEDLLGDEDRVPYRSEKYKSPAPREDLKMSEVGQVTKSLIPSRSFFSGHSQASEGRPEGMEETLRPRRRFLKKGEGTARFRMRPMRLRRSRLDAEEECAWQGSKDVPKEVSPALTPAKSQVRVSMPRLEVCGSPAVGGQRTSVTRSLQGTPHYNTETVLASTHPPTQPSLHPYTSSVTNNPARPPAPSLQHLQASTHPLDATRLPSSPHVDLEKQQRKEAAELSAFEKLEELAEDSSFSSNSSTVWGLLRQGQHSVSSTPMRTPPPLALQETPVVSSVNAKPVNLSESHFLGLVGKGQPPMSALQHQHTLAPVDVKEVLAQLKAIVRLEGHSISDITESDIQSFLDGYSNNIHQPPAAPHPTSTPISPQPVPPPLPCDLTPHQTQPHHVHFASEGVQVLEYQLSDTEGDDTLTDATSLDSDMITTSDLEALTHLSISGAEVDPEVQKSQSCKETHNSDTSSSGDATLTEQPLPQSPQPGLLLFSPPPTRPPQSASNYIWSIFGKERDAKKLSTPKTAPKTTKETAHHPPQRPQKYERRNELSIPAAHPKTDAKEEELEVHKTLLLAKVAELEKETKLFKNNNAKLHKLQQKLKEEKQRLEKEKQKLQEDTATERRRFQEYVDRERNALWNEKQQILQQPPPALTQSREHMMEVVRLREQIREMQEEAERKASLDQFAVKKLNDRIKTLENENKKLKDKNNSLQNLEKENQDLRLKLDRAKACGRTKAPPQPSKATRERAKVAAKPRTADGVTKLLDKLSKPQPVIIRETQRKAATTHKQDLANNNINTAPTDPDEAVLKPRNTTKPPPQASLDQNTPEVESHTSDGVEHSEGQSVSWDVRGCVEEAGLEHTERLREDGVREVIYANGNRKEIHPSGDVIVSFYNGDRKEVRGDRTVYVYGSDNTSHTTYSDGREELVFPNGQTETHCSDGSSEIAFPDGSRKTVMSDGTEVCTTRDGSVVRTNPDGSKVFEFPSGQREVHREGEKRREYPDGTVKIVHPDGRTETRYSSGRLRIRDREGNVILDTHVSVSPPPPHPSLSL